jgi:predicted deacylase
MFTRIPAVLMLVLMSSLLAGQEINRSLYNYSKLEARIKALTNGITGGKISISVIGKTHGGRDLLCVKFTGESAAAGGGEKRLLIIGGTHSLEWPGYECGVRFAETLASNMKAGVSPYATVYIVPAVNPDGFDYMQYIPKPYYNARKNLGFSPSEKNPRVYTQGVDINRNFPCGWKFQSSPYSVFYAGAKPGSEPETRAVMDLTRAVKPYFAISLHSPGRRLLYPWGYKKDKINDPALVGTCEEFAKRVGYGYRAEQDYTNYPKFGDEIDWFYGELHIPCFRLEMARDLITYTFEEYGGVEKALFWLINEKLKS